MLGVNVLSLFIFGGGWLLGRVLDFFLPELHWHRIEVVHWIKIFLDDFIYWIFFFCFWLSWIELESEKIRWICGIKEIYELKKWFWLEFELFRLWTFMAFEVDFLLSLLIEFSSFFTWFLGFILDVKLLGKLKNNSTVW